MLVAFVIALCTLVRSLVFGGSEQHDSANSSAQSDDPTPGNFYPASASKYNDTELLSSVLQTLQELEEKIGTLQGRPFQMPYDKEELLNAAVCRVDALEAELIATKKVKFVGTWFSKSANSAGAIMLIVGYLFSI